MDTPRHYIALPLHGWAELVDLTLPLVWEAYGLRAVVVERALVLPYPWGLWLP